MTSENPLTVVDRLLPRVPGRQLVDKLVVRRVQGEGEAEEFAEGETKQLVQARLGSSRQSLAQRRQVRLDPRWVHERPVEMEAPSQRGPRTAVRVDTERRGTQEQQELDQGGAIGPSISNELLDITILEVSARKELGEMSVQAGRRDWGAEARHVKEDVADVGEDAGSEGELVTRLQVRQPLVDLAVDRHAPVLLDRHEQREVRVQPAGTVVGERVEHVGRRVDDT